MARGIWVSPDEFVAFSEPQKSLTAQIASRSRAIDFYGLGMYLPNPDPILKAQGRDIRIYRELRTDPLVGGCIRRRKAALKSLERGLERGHASARVFRFIRDMLDDLDLSRIIGEMSDAVLYGYQPCEIMWGRSVRAWAVTDIVGKPPEWFQFDTDNCLRFRARDAGVEGELLSPSKFVVPAQDASYDNPYGFPDLSMCFWPVAFKKGGMKFWLRFAEKFGSPWVIGKHPRGANDAEIEKLLDSMEQMVEDAVAAIPDDSSIELKAADGKADSSEVFRELITLSRSEISIALLGQNQTTEANSNKASAQAGLEVTADTTFAQALAGRGPEGTINFNTSSDRVRLCYPHVKVYDPVTNTERLEPLSQRAAGLRARVDLDKGYWWSSSNQEILGITGVERQLSAMIDDPQSEVNLLNEQGITTVFSSYGSGLRLWGNRTAAWPTVTHMRNFENVRRTGDVINESIRYFSQQYIDMPITQALIDALTESVNAYGRKMTGDGAVLGFRCWFDPARNPETELAAGHLLLSYKYTPPPPLERLTFETEITSEYLLTLKGGN